MEVNGFYLRDDGENRGSPEGRQTKGIERVEHGVNGRQTEGVEADGVEGRQARENEEIDGVESRQAKVSEKMGDGGERRQARGIETRRLAWMGDGGGSEEANGVDMCSPIKHICLFHEETPQPRSDPPPIVRMARWPKTAGELGNCISAETRAHDKKGRVLCL